MAMAPADVLIRLKEAALPRALDNLLTNALRHGKPPIALSAVTRNGDITFDVRDSGHGISPAEVQDLMRPFARGNAARAGEGKGLGFAIVDQVAKAHRGSLEFEQGAETFTARLRIPQAVLA